MDKFQSISIQKEMQYQQKLKKYSYLDQYKILHRLGSGYHAQVKLGMDAKGNLFAIKRYKTDTADLSTLQYELKMMKILQHQNLLRLCDVRENATYRRKDGTSYKCFAIILQYGGGGELYDLVAETGKFSERVARTYFIQMMNGLSYIHSMGYAHRDLKPENIFLSNQFKLKIGDLGFAFSLKGENGTGIFHTKLGTEGYMAPQIQQRNYKGAKIDIFSAGVILFIMYAGKPPFQNATPSDPYYKLIKQHTQSSLSIYWKAHLRNRPQDYFSQSFKDLYLRMVAYNPDERPTIQQIFNHPWVRGPVCSYSEIKVQFEERKKALDVVLQTRRLEKEAQRARVMNPIQSNVISSEPIDKKKKKIKDKQNSIVSAFKNFFKENFLGKSKNSIMQEPICIQG